MLNDSNTIIVLIGNEKDYVTVNLYILLEVNNILLEFPRIQNLCLGRFESKMQQK